ncbi:hypothetical protein M8C21_029010 [Ambrosia artemisiifolia]|uniref:YTH domain-containing family protein n=1 Tax=Ambrosia artemisiifolia TaxID=4212 RepID=A0AAD5GLM2_AMBAR|nr:hypothetical protein M8C21_029010 [Ambrosia artemisiifolia]
MEQEKSQQVKDQPSPSSIGDGVVSDNYMDKPLSPKNERIVSPNPSPDASIIRNISNQSEALNASGSQNPVNQSNFFTSQEQTYVYGASGYDDGASTWGDYSNYVHANNLQVLPSAMYNDNASLLFHPAYGFDAQMAYGQFSPVASPLSPIMIDGQLFSPHQVPMSPNYYSQPVSPHVTSALPTDLATSASRGQEALSENVFMGPGSGYYLQYGGNSNLGFYKYPGDIGSAESAPNRSMSSDTSSYASPLTSAALYPAPVGTLGSYEHIFSQIPQQQTAYGYGSVSGSSQRRYPQSGSYRGYNSSSLFHAEASRLNHFAPDKGGRNRERDALNMISEPHGTSGDLKTIVWASTPLGNRKLDAAYQEAKESGATCPVFLFFSQDRWSGQFRVKWHIIKDVPNSRFRHILLENNDNKPVTHSRDSQEVKLEAGNAMLKIFKDHDADTSILDDFSYYDEREKNLQEKKAKERDLTKNIPAAANDTSINQLADKVAESLHVEEHREVHLGAKRNMQILTSVSEVVSGRHSEKAVASELTV